MVHGCERVDSGAIEVNEHFWNFIGWLAELAVENLASALMVLLGGWIWSLGKPLRNWWRKRG